MNEKILRQYMWYNASIKVDKTFVQFSWFSEKNMFHNFLVTMVAPLKNGMNLRENEIYVKILVFSECK